jgi:hypothetical protein
LEVFRNFLEKYAWKYLEDVIKNLILKEQLTKVSKIHGQRKFLKV